MASKRQTLLEYLRTLLATITTGNGYNTSVVTVERGIKNIRELADAQLPAIFITMTHEKRERITQRDFKAGLQVLLVGYVRNTNASLDPSTTGVELDLDKFIEDVTKCILADPLQKDGLGNARVTDTVITDVATDDGDLFPTSGFVISVVFSYAAGDITP